MTETQESGNGSARPGNSIRIAVGSTLRSSRVVVLEFDSHQEFLAWLASDDATSRPTTTEPGPEINAKDGKYIVAPMRNGHRSAENVEPATHVCLDLDHLGNHVNELSVSEALAGQGYICAAWQTNSSIPEAPRWRIVYCLGSSVDRDEYAQLHHELETDVRARLGCESADVDLSASRPEQPQLLRPADRDIVVVAAGVAVPVREILSQSRATSREPLAPARARVSTSEPEGGDPPALPWLIEQMEARGMEPRRLRQGQWSVRCPWESEHTSAGPADGSDTVVFEPHYGGFRGWGFKCHHSHCAGRKFRPHVMEVLGLVPASGAVWDSDLMNAQRFARVHGDDLRFTREQGWLAWDGRRWASDRGDLAMQRAKAFAEVVAEDPTKQFRQVVGDVDRWAKRTQSGAGLRAMLQLAESEPPIAAQILDFDTHPMLLNLSNGVLDLETGLLRPHERGLLLTRVCPVNFDPVAACPTFDGFLWHVLAGDEELYRYVQRAVGYTLTGLTSEQVFFFAFGLGANGKSVLLEILLALLGDYGTTARTEILMSRSGGSIPNDIAALRGRRLVAVNETADHQRLNEPIVKDLTGGDAISARFLFKEFFAFRPECKLWLRGNHKPAIYGTDHGIWRRVHLLPFTVTIPRDQQNPGLLAELALELPGILNWGLQGCLAWQREGLRPPTTVLDAVHEYRSEMDVLGGFLGECTEQAPAAEERASELYSAYQRWCEEGGEWVMSGTKFGRAMRERGFCKVRKQAGIWYRGVRLRRPAAVTAGLARLRGM